MNEYRQAHCPEYDFFNLAGVAGKGEWVIRYRKLGASDQAKTLIKWQSASGHR